MCRDDDGSSIFQQGEMDGHWERRLKPILIGSALIGFIIFLKEGCASIARDQLWWVNAFQHSPAILAGVMFLSSHYGKILLSWIALHVPP